MVIANATRGCSCIDASASLSSLFCQTLNNETGIQVEAGGTCFPLSYGSSQCLPHDLIHDSACQVDRHENLVPSYCIRPWCYVDAGECKRDSDERVYRSKSFPSDSGVDLFYSYSTCNSTADDWLDFTSSKAMGGISMMASVPSYQDPLMFKRDPVTGEAFTTIGGEYYDDSIPYEGVYPDYVKSIVELSNGDIKNVSYTYRSRASSLVHPTSTYTATVQDIQDGLIDMGVAPFWITAQRLTMVGFTIPFLYDKIFLVVTTSSETLTDQISKVFAPFSADLWLVILLTIIAAALLSVWFSDRFHYIKDRGGDDPQYRRSTAYARLALDSFLEKGTYFFSAGVEQDSGSSLSYKVLMFGFGFLILIAVSAYVANLAAFLTQSTATSVNTMEMAIKEGYQICAHPVLKTELKAAWPNANFLFSESGQEVRGMIADFEAKKCQALAIGWEDNTQDINLREMLCDNNLVFTDSLIIETPIAFPIKAELASGFSYWMLQAERFHDISMKNINKESLDQMRDATSCPLTLSEQGKETGDSEQITIRNFFFPLVVFLACACLAIILQLVHHCYLGKGEGATIVGRSSQLDLVTEMSSRDRVAQLKSRMTRCKSTFDIDKEDEEEEEEELDSEFLSCVNSESISTEEEVQKCLRFDV